MSAESNSKTQGTPSGKPTAKRAHRANRPVLVTEKTSAGPAEPTRPTVEEASQPEIPLAAEPAAPAERKRKPGFFANIGKTEKETGEKKADPQAARMARAMRGMSVDTSKEKDQGKEKKAPATNGPARSGTAPARPRSGFKMRYIMGMMAYLLIADFLGVLITNWMVANKLDGVVFTIGSFRATRSTLIFLALLIVILIVMARLDLIPRSLRSISEPATPRNASTPVKKASNPTFETKPARPTVKQGVKGEHDDLYQEYRANQRYFQKRDRKR
jgi:hypothetical protein